MKTFDDFREFKGRLGSFTFYEWVKDFIELLVKSFISAKTTLDNTVTSVASLETFSNGLLTGIPNYETSFEALDGGLDYKGIYRTNNTLKTVGSDLAVTLLSFKATAGVEITSPDIYLIDPYTRGVYAQDTLVLNHTGLAGTTTLLTTPEEPITILSADIDGYVNTSSSGAIEIQGAPEIIGLYAPSASSVNVDGCLLIEEFNASSATVVTAVDCATLTGVICPNATDITLSGCALTAQTIEDLLVSLETTGNENGVLDISGGTSETYANWTVGAIAALETLETTLGWTVTFNGQV